MTRSIFITGAASGIGRAAALRFASEGWLVGATDVNPEGLERLRAEIGTEHFFRVLDVSSAVAVKAALSDFALVSDGKLDLLLNSAGIGVLSDFEDARIEALHATVEVNVKGVINCCHAAFPYLKASGHAKVINMSSLSSEYGVPSEAVYSASKFFVRGLTEAMNIEWERHGIHVCDVMPNFVKTPMMEGVTGKLVDSIGVNLTADDVVRAIWNSVVDRHRVHWIVDGPKTTVLRLLGRVLPNFVRREMMKKLAGY